MGNGACVFLLTAQSTSSDRLGLAGGAPAAEPPALALLPQAGAVVRAASRAAQG